MILCAAAIEEPRHRVSWVAGTGSRFRASVTSRLACIFRSNMHPEGRNRPAASGLFGANPAKWRNAKCISAFWRIGRAKRLTEPLQTRRTFHVMKSAG
jgi:hypothetical protein